MRCFNVECALISSRKKTRLGNWEIGTVIGQNHQGALVTTIVDRVVRVYADKKVVSMHAEVRYRSHYYLAIALSG